MLLKIDRASHSCTQSLLAAEGGRGGVSILYVLFHLCRSKRSTHGIASPTQ